MYRVKVIPGHYVEHKVDTACYHPTLFRNDKHIIMPTDYDHDHYLASKRGDTDTGLIKLLSGEDVCGVVRESVGLPDCL